MGLHLNKRFITGIPEDRVPPKPTDLECDVTLEYVDFGFTRPEDNWRILSVIQFAEQEHGNPKYFNSDAREVYMDWTFEDAKWRWGILDIDDGEVRNAIADYLATERLWNDGEYVHPYAFN